MTGRSPIPIALPSVGEEELRLLAEVIKSGWLTQGPKVEAFEKAFAARHGTAQAIAVTSCTTGLHLVLAALGVGPGDEVIVPALTWVATSNAVLHCGAVPVLVDIDRRTFNMDISAAAAKVTKHTKAVIPVHLFGLCADIDALRDAMPGDVAIVEDAACAAGAEYKGRPAGSLGKAGVFSFHPRKSITTGEGGMITTNDTGLANRLRQLRNHGATVSEEQRHRGPSPHLMPDFPALGYNYRMTDLQGAVGLAQLAKLDHFINDRARLAAAYSERLGDLDWLHLPGEPANGRHAWQAFVAYVDPETAPMSAVEVMDALEHKGVATRPGTHAVHTLTYYRDRFGLHPDDFPQALAAAANTLAIPLHNRLTENDFEVVVAALREL